MSDQDLRKYINAVLLKKNDKKVKSVITIGDVVYYQSVPGGTVEMDWRVVSTHLLNQHGYALDMLIENRKGQRLRHFMGSSWPTTEQSPGVLILASTIPQNAAKYRDTVKVVIDKYDGTYIFFCTKCLSTLTIVQTTEEVSDLRMHEDGSISQSKPTISDGREEVLCRCMDEGDQTHEIEFDAY